MGRTFKSQTVENCFQEILDGVKMRAAALALFALPSALGANSSCAPPWAATCAIVDAFGAATQLVDFAVSVSIDADGATGARVFTRELGATTMQTVMNVASSSKWPSTVTVLRAAARGELDLDAPLAAAIPWWPRDARRDARARRQHRVPCTLRRRLSLTLRRVLAKTARAPDRLDIAAAIAAGRRPFT